MRLTQSLLCTPTYTTLVRDWLPYWTASVRYQLTFSHLNLSPPTYHHQRSRIHVDRLTYNARHESSVNDASNPKKQLYKKWSDTSWTLCSVNGLCVTGVSAHIITPTFIFIRQNTQRRSAKSRRPETQQHSTGSLKPRAAPSSLDCYNLLFNSS